MVLMMLKMRSTLTCLLRGLNTRGHGTRRLKVLELEEDETWLLLAPGAYDTPKNLKRAFSIER